MMKMLLAAAGSIAAIALAAGGAQAQSSGHHSGPFVGQPSGTGQFADNRFRRDCDGRHCRSRSADTAVVMDWYGGEWARWNNRSWEPTSYNDWWHEAPSRAYPAWMSRNQDCQRQWYSADTLRC